MQRIATLLILAGLTTFSAQAQNEPNQTFGPAPAPAPSASPSQPTEFNAGIKAMNDGHWKEALADFDKVHDASEEIMAQAMYWKAYNQQKLDQNGESSETCRSLRKKYPSSTWVGECAQLRAQKVYFVRNADSKGDLDNIQIKLDDLQVQSDAMDVQAQAYAAHAQAYRDHAPFIITTEGSGPKSFTIHTGKVDPNDEIKLIALNSMMQQEPDKALPAVRAFLTSDKPIEAKRRAMFVLEQSKSPEAQKLLADTAASSKEPELQRAAVWALASTPKTHTAELLSIYKSSSDHDVKRAAASGLMSARDAKDLIEIARVETDPEMKRTLVQFLSDMHDPAALAYMEELAQ